MPRPWESCRSPRRRGGRQRGPPAGRVSGDLAGDGQAVHGLRVRCAAGRRGPEKGPGRNGRADGPAAPDGCGEAVGAILRAFEDRWRPGRSASGTGPADPRAAGPGPRIGGQLSGGGSPSGAHARKAPAAGARASGNAAASAGAARPVRGPGAARGPGTAGADTGRHTVAQPGEVLPGERKSRSVGMAQGPPRAVRSLRRGNPAPISWPAYAAGQRRPPVQQPGGRRLCAAGRRGDRGERIGDRCRRPER